MKIYRSADGTYYISMNGSWLILQSGMWKNCNIPKRAPMLELSNNEIEKLTTQYPINKML